MKTLDEIEKTIAAHKAELEEKFGVKTIGVFGSYVRGEQKDKSDIDILVEFYKPIDFIRFIELEEHLGALLDARVDLVTKKALKPIMGKLILEEVVYV